MKVALRLLLSAALIAGSVAILASRAAALSVVTLYVDATSTFGAADCTAPAPCPTINDALAIAASDAGSQVVVSIAPGTYPESINVTPPTGGGLFLQGAGAGSTTITGTSAGPVVSVTGAVTLDSVAVTGGSTGIEVTSSGGTVALTNDWVHDNHSTSSAAGGVDVTAGPVVLVNDTISVNSTGLQFTSGVTATISNSTLAGNTGVAITNNGTLSADNVTLRANPAAGIAGNGSTTLTRSLLSGSPCTSAVTDGGYNVADDSSCNLGSSSLSNAAAGFSGPISATPATDANGSFGPPVQTISSSSAAFLEVPASLCSGGSDERGFPRPGFGVTGAPCAAGAYEPQRTSVLAQSAPTSAVVATDGSAVDLQMATAATFVASASSVPSGVTVSASGKVVVGPATAPGNYLLGGFAYNANSLAVGTWTLNLHAVARPTITTTAVPQVVQGATYRFALSATGGISPYAWSVAAGTLPDGLSLSPDGVISGTATTLGDYTVTFGLSDSASPPFTASATFTLSVVQIAVTSTALPAGPVDVAYRATLTSQGGTGTKTWTRTSGTLPAGLTMTAAGVISGTPTKVGTSTFTVKVTDGSNPKKSGTGTVVITINPMTVATASLPAGLIDKAYTSTTLKTLGGKAAFVWTVVGGALPTGMKLATTGALSGTPTVAGAFTFTVSVHDASVPANVASATLHVVIAPMSITTTALPAATSHKAYSTTLKAVGGKIPYTFTVSAGSLPSGIKLSAAGGFSGTPTVAGRYTFTVRLVDKAVPANVAMATFTLTVN